MILFGKLAAVRNLPAVNYIAAKKRLWKQLKVFVSTATLQ
jgi:hypothetical protein